MSFSSAAVLAVECEGWDFPRVWDGRLVRVSPRELKLLSRSLPKHQLTRAGASSKQTAPERTRAGVPWPAARRGGPSDRSLCSQRCGLHRRRARVQGPWTPTPRGGRRLSRGRLCPGRVMACLGCFCSLLWEPLDPALRPCRLAESRCSSRGFSCRPARACVCLSTCVSTCPAFGP